MTDPVLGFLRDEKTDEKFVFQFNFEQLKLSLGAEWTAVSPRGSSHARQSFKHSKGRTFSLKLRFLREAVDAKDIEQRIREVEALSFPDYDRSGRLSDAPHPLFVVFGAWRTMRCVLTDVELSMEDVWWDPDTLRPGGFDATVTFVDVPAGGDVSRADVRAGA